jgi:WhiB family redox-sensing transcriptional regulator
MQEVGRYRPTVLIEIAPPSVPAMTTWEHRAACRAAPDPGFYPPLGHETPERRRAREAQAKLICATCPVRAECLAYALRVHEHVGIWGGLSENERYRFTARTSS